MTTILRALLPLTLLLGTGGRAFGFSGIYAGGADDRPTNHESRAVLARAGQATTLTLFNDVQTGQQVFGLVVPVPVAIDADNVRVVSPDVLHDIEAYSAPRTRELSCQELYFRADPDDSLDLGCSLDFSSDETTLWFETETDGLGWTDDVTGVTVADRFTVGEYEAFVLQGTDASGLRTWLSDQGLQLPPDSDEVVDEAIALGSYFLALRVELDELPEGITWLRPVQVGYVAESWTLPLRMGTFSSGGLQDLVLFLLTDADMGEVSIENYGTPAEIPTDCLLSDPTEAEAVYDRLLSESLGLPGRPEDLGGAKGLAWAVEHRWEDGACEPCTEVGVLAPEDVEELGMPDGNEPYLMTRVRIRYTPEAMTEDPRLVASGAPAEPVQKRYYVGTWEIAGELPACEDEPIAEVGQCYSSSWLAYRETLEPSDKPMVLLEDPDGCKHKRALLLLALPTLGLLRRRRRS